MPSPDHRVALGATLIRVAVASVFVIHGVTRVMNGTVAHRLGRSR